MKRLQFSLFLLFILTDVAFSQRNPEITAKELKTDVYFLASDSTNSGWKISRVF
jgi:hypothetical protein